MITLALMEMGHIPEVMDLEKRCFSNPWSLQAYLFEKQDNPHAYYLVALDDGKVIGYGGMWLIFDEAHVTNIAVSPRYRRRGLGETILRCLMLRAAARGGQRMTLEVRRSNLGAQRLYQKLGFVGVGYRKGYYSDNQEDALIMWRENLQLIVAETGEELPAPFELLAEEQK